MARPHRQGLSYYNIDPTWMDDIKVQSAEDYLDTSGRNSFLTGDTNHLKLILYTFISRSWNLIYHDQGYYMIWNSETSLVMARKCFTTTAVIKIIVEALLHVGWFNNEKFNKYNILTSNGIQKRFFKVANEAKRVEVKMEEDYLILPEENPIIQKYLTRRRNKTSGDKNVSSGRNTAKKTQKVSDIKTSKTMFQTYIRNIQFQGEFLPEETEFLPENFRKKLPLNIISSSSLYKDRYRLSIMQPNINTSINIYDDVGEFFGFFRKKLIKPPEEIELLQEETIIVPEFTVLLPEETNNTSGSNANNSIEMSLEKYNKSEKTGIATEFTLEELYDVYFNHRSFSGTRETVASMHYLDGMEMLKRWGLAFKIWLYGSANFRKTPRDFADHFFKWMNKNYRKGLVPEEIHNKQSHKGQNYGGKQNAGPAPGGTTAGIKNEKLEEFFGRERKPRVR